MNLAVYDGNGNRALGERDTFDVVQQAAALAKQIAGTEFVPAALKHRPEAIMAAMLTGFEIGLPPMASLSNIHVIEGKPTLSAQGMRALVMSRGHTISFPELSISRVTIVGRRRGEDASTTVTWTLDDARRAQLANKQNWQRYPRQMLMARATGELCRAVFPDVLGGIAYTTEELQDGLALKGDSVPGTAEPEAPKTRRKARDTEQVANRVPPPGGAETLAQAEPSAAWRLRSDERVPPPGGAETLAQAEPPPEPPLPEPPPLKPEPPASTAGEKQEGESLSLAQQIAMVCREAGINRNTLVKALTGKERGSDVSRTEAAEILNVARAIERGEMRFELDGNEWKVLPVEQPGLGLEG